MLWLIVLFIVLQPSIFSKKKAPVNISDIFMRALVFGVIMYFLKSQGLEGFQTAPAIPTCAATDGIMYSSKTGKYTCLAQDPKAIYTIASDESVNIYFNSSQFLTTSDMVLTIPGMPSPPAFIGLQTTASNWPSGLGPYPGSALGINLAKYDSVLIAVPAATKTATLNGITDATLKTYYQNHIWGVGTGLMVFLNGPEDPAATALPQFPPAPVATTAATATAATATAAPATAAPVATTAATTAAAATPVDGVVIGLAVGGIVSLIGIGVLMIRST